MPLTPDEVREAFLFACRTEIAALKPGNVHVYADGHRMTAADFEASAAAAAPYIAAPDLTAGECIHAAMRATWDAVGQNTNLGILLLAAPLAHAALCTADNLRNALRHVLDNLTVADAAEAFAAISLANPGGLGEAPEQDVRRPPAVTLTAAMRLAQHRDRIARQYATAYEDIFETAVPALKDGMARSGDAASAATYAYLTMLAAFPDTHIVRKYGADIAEGVRREAAPHLAALKIELRPENRTAALLAFDWSLKERAINPGTTADLTVAALFAWRLERRV
jgi:triphosphoribosyl-dephospho-CoA synthase